MQYLRKILFYLLAALYIIITPVVILYAFGYIFKPGAGETVIKTGLIYIDTAPPGADVLLNGKLYMDKTPATIRDLVPGMYDVSLELEGYRTWERTVPVEQEIATVLDKILLIPTEWSREIVARETSFREIIPVPGNGYLVLVGEGGTLGDAFVYSCGSDSPTPLLGDGSPFSSLKITSFYTVEDSSQIILKTVGSGTGIILRVRPGSPLSATEDITDLFQVPPEHIKWSPGQEDILFSFQEGYINRVDVKAGAVYPRQVSGVRGYAVFGGNLYVLKEDYTLRKVSYSGEEVEALLDDGATGKTIFTDKGYYDIKMLSRDYILFVSEKGQLVSNRLPYLLAANGINGLEMYPPGNKVLIWGKGKIGVVDFGKESTGNVVSEKGPSVNWIYTGGREIGRAFFVYGDSHVLFRDGKESRMIDTRPGTEPSPDTVAEVRRDGSVYYCEKNGILYYLSPGDAGLMCIEIVPQKQILPAVITESLQDTGGDNEARTGPAVRGE